MKIRCCVGLSLCKFLVEDGRVNFVSLVYVTFFTTDIRKKYENDGGASI